MPPVVGIVRVWLAGLADEVLHDVTFVGSVVTRRGRSAGAVRRLLRLVERKFGVDAVESEGLGGGVEHQGAAVGDGLLHALEGGGGLVRAAELKGDGVLGLGRGVEGRGLDGRGDAKLGIDSETSLSIGLRRAVLFQTLAKDDRVAFA